MFAATLPRTAPTSRRSIPFTSNTPTRRPRMDVASDTDLCHLLEQGDQEALSALYARYSQPIYALVLRVVRSDELAEEVVQETFVRVWRSVAKFQVRSEHSFAAWLFRIARNLALDQLRRQATRPRTVEVEDNEEGETWFMDQLRDEKQDVAEQAWQQWRSQKVIGAIAALPQTQRQAVEMVYLEGLTHREIAERLSQPLGTIKTRVRLGLQKLGSSLELADCEPW